MSRPDGFTWVEKPNLAAHARPGSLEHLIWLRKNGIQFVLTVTESPLRRDWVNDAGLLAMHIPVEDMEAPTQEQFDQALSALKRAKEQGFGASVHCAAGLGRTGTILAAWFVSEGFNAVDAIKRVRRLRPGSIETETQERAIADLARRLRAVS